MSSSHPALVMLGPCVARNDAVAAPLVWNELNHLKGRTPLFLMPADHDRLLDCNGRRIASTGRAAAASCSRRYARLISTVDASASTRAMAVDAFTSRVGTLIGAELQPTRRY